MSKQTNRGMSTNMTTTTSVLWSYSEEKVVNMCVCHMLRVTRQTLTLHRTIADQTTVAQWDHGQWRHLICPNQIIIMQIQWKLHRELSFLLCSAIVNVHYKFNIMIWLWPITWRHWSDWATTVWCGRSIPIEPELLPGYSLLSTCDLSFVSDCCFHHLICVLYFVFTSASWIVYGLCLRL